jgi:hypothetical protein
MLGEHENFPSKELGTLIAGLQSEVRYLKLLGVGELRYDHLIVRAPKKSN